LKTRHWDETEKALIAMVEASREASEEFFADALNHF
jgi:5-methyltetrahydropteroyltriglutamate--homocysteine methyltransferase